MTDNKYGILPMSQARYTYKSIEQRTKYDLALMELNNNQLEREAKANVGLVNSYVNTADEAADNAGEAYRLDAINSAIQAGVGAAAIVGTAGMYYKTSNSELDSEIEDVNLMKKDLDAPYQGGFEQGEDVEAAQEKRSLPPANDAVQQKLKDWSEVGGSKFKNYQRIQKNLSQKDLEQANLNKELNKEAIEYAKSPQYKEKIQKNLEEYSKELQEQKRSLSQQFNNFIQTVNVFQPSILAMAQTSQSFKKADVETRAQQEQAAAQVLNNVAQKQGAFIDKERQEAQQNLQSANSDAASLGQIQQTRG